MGPRGKEEQKPELPCWTLLPLSGIPKSFIFGRGRVLITVGALGMSDPRIFPLTAPGWQCTGLDLQNYSVCGGELWKTLGLGTPVPGLATFSPMSHAAMDCLELADKHENTSL